MATAAARPNLIKFECAICYCVSAKVVIDEIEVHREWLIIRNFAAS